MRARIAILVVALLLGVLAAYFAATYLMGARQVIEEEQEPVEVLVAQQDLEPGATAEELLDQEYIALEEIPRQYVSEGAVSSPVAIEDKVLATAVAKGEQITEARFKLPEEAGLAYAVPKDFMAVSIPNNAITGVSGLIRPGDHVAVFSTFDPTASAEEAVTRIVIPKARVLAVGADVSAEEAPLDEAEEDSGVLGGGGQVGTMPDAPGTVTLALAAADAEKVVFTAELGSVWLGLLSSETAEIPSTPGQRFPGVIE
jgi:pilus assembly protein CpaB